MAGSGATQPHSQHAPPPPFPTPGATARAAARSRALVPLPATVSDFLPGAGAGAGAAILQAGATAGLGAGSSMAHSRGSRRKQASSSRPTRHVTGTAHPGLPAVYGYINTNANTFSAAAAAPHSHVHMQLAHNEMSVDLDWIDNGASVGSATAAAAAASGAGRCDDTFRGGDDDYTIAEEHEGEGSAVQSAPAAAAAAAAPTSVASTPLQPPTNPRTPISTAVEDVLGVSVTLPPDTEAILAQVLGAMVGTLLAKGTAAAAAAAAAGRRRLYGRVLLQVQAARDFPSDCASTDRHPELVREPKFSCQKTSDVTFCVAWSDLKDRLRRHIKSHALSSLAGLYIFRSSQDLYKCNHRILREGN